MWDMTGSAKAWSGSGAAAAYSAGVTVPARAKPPTNEISSIWSILRRARARALGRASTHVRLRTHWM